MFVHNIYIFWPERLFGISQKLLNQVIGWFQTICAVCTKYVCTLDIVHYANNISLDKKFKQSVFLKYTSIYMNVLFHKLLLYPPKLPLQCWSNSSQHTFFRQILTDVPFPAAIQSSTSFFLQLQAASLSSSGGPISSAVVMGMYCPSSSSLQPKSVGVILLDSSSNQSLYCK